MMDGISEWEVELFGNRTDLKQLVKSFTGPELQIVEDDGRYHLKSFSFNGIDDPKEIRKISEELAELLSGASVLRLGARTPIKAGAIVKVKGTNRGIYLEASVRATARVFATATLTTADGKVEVSNPADPVRRWLEVALENPAARDVLALLNAENQDWANLYRIYEIIEYDVDGPDEMARIGSISKAKLRRFKHTANSRKAAGLNSRHAVEKTDPPKNPMNINKAKRTIFRIVEAWLNAKG